MKHALPALILLPLAAPLWAMAPAAPPAPAAATVPAPRPAGAADSMQPAVQTTPPAGAPRAQDRLELDTTQITGNRELPRVLYVVPWKRPDAGELAGKPANSLLDEVLAPVDRDVFRRQNRYYQALKPDSPAGDKTSRAEGEK